MFKFDVMSYVIFHWMALGFMQLAMLHFMTKEMSILKMSEDVH